MSTAFSSSWRYVAKTKSAQKRRKNLKQIVARRNRRAGKTKLDDAPVIQLNSRDVI